MRIAIFVRDSIYNQPTSSLARHTHLLATGLAEISNEVHVFCAGNFAGKAVEPHKNLFYHFCAFLQEENFVDEIQHFCHALVAKLGEVEVESGKFDIVHAEDWTTINAGVWVKESGNYPLVISFHSLEFARHGKVHSGGDSARIEAHEENGCKQADRLIALTHGVQRDLVEVFPVSIDKCQVINHGIDLEPFAGIFDPGQVKAQLKFRPSQPLVLFSSPLEYRFAPDLLLEAIPEACRNWADLRFVFAGTGAQAEYLQNRSRELGIGHALRFLSNLTWEQEIALYKASDIVVLPYRHEPFNLHTLQAWAAGKPLIANNEGGGEYIWHEVNGLHVYCESSSIVWALNYLRQDLELCRWLGENGRIAAETAFSVKHLAKQTLALYQELCC